MTLKRSPIYLFAAAFLMLAGVSHASSTLVYPVADGRLAYGTYANEGQTNAVNTIPDYSMCGYQGGGVSIPYVPVAATVYPAPGDDRVNIQNAIDYVASLPVNADGFRGAVLLKAGEYEADSTIYLDADGIVLRGEGQQDSGGTRITCTATSQVTLIQAGYYTSGPTEIGGTRVNITDSYVPVGAKSFNVSDASGYAVGDRIMIHRKTNQAWIDEMETESFTTPWTVAAYQFHYDRIITDIDGSLITVDGPVVQAIEDQYGGGDIYTFTVSHTEHVGVENMRLESTYASDTDESHGWTAIDLIQCENAWVRQVTARYFGYGCVNIKDDATKFVTIEDCAMLDPKSITTGGRKYSFNIADGSFVLFQRCYTRGGRHDYATGSKVLGPVAFVDCVAEDTNSDTGPHHRYAHGLLFDNIDCGQLRVQDRDNSGTGHGWAGAQTLFWNCFSYKSDVKVDSPPGAKNWGIGCIGQTQNGAGFWESWGTRIDNPRSLYYSQLLDRAGVDALGRTALRYQYGGTIWSYLSAWAGEGLLFDRVTAGADRTITDENEPLVLTGMVRDLGLLDAGSAISWSKVSGLGDVQFSDPASTETAVTFNKPGIYVLRLTADDEVAPVSDEMTVSIALSPATVCSVEDSYEGDTLGAHPGGASEVGPSVNINDCFVMVVDAAANTAGSGNGVQIFDNNGSRSTKMSYDFAAGTDAQLSSVRAEFSFACLDASGLGDDAMFISFGEYGNSLASSSGRFSEARLFNDGTIDFISASGADVYNIDISTGAHTLIIFANDFDAQSVEYTGPDDNLYTLAANAVAYWLDGALILFSGAGYTSLDLSDLTPGGTVGTTEDNLGRFGFSSYTHSTNLSYVIDDIVVCGQLPAEPSLRYGDWLALYPALGSATNYTDDLDLDDMDNLLEYALGGQPTLPDAAAVRPAYGLAEEGGANGLYYVYRRNAAAIDLIYRVNSTVDLAAEPLTDTVEWVGASGTIDGFRSVTNRIPIDGDATGFIGLSVEITE